MCTCVTCIWVHVYTMIVNSVKIIIIMLKKKKKKKKNIYIYIYIYIYIWDSSRENFPIDIIL